MKTQQSCVEHAVFHDESFPLQIPKNPTTGFITKDKNKIFPMRIFFMLATDSLLSDGFCWFDAVARCYKTHFCWQGRNQCEGKEL